MFNTTDVPKSSRIPKLIAALYAHMPVIESARAKLITESYKATEGQPTITRRAEAFAHILRNIPIIIRDDELIVGSRNFPISGWRMNWIRLQQGPRIHFTLPRKLSRS
jgi:pyruvate-formate lyase